MLSLITPRELPKWVPGKVLSASDALGWKVVGMGVYTFSRHFRETLGRAPHAFVIDRRVERAK